MKLKICGPITLILVASLVVEHAHRLAHADAFKVTRETDIESLAKQVTAGDTIVLKNGIWRDADLKFERLAGKRAEPIQIRAETSGEVIFTGATEFRVSGQHIIVSGFVFRDTNGASDVVQLRTHSQRHAHHCRLTDCVFEQTPGSAVGTESRWLSVFGTNNRIDHCYFGGKRSRGPTLVVWVSEAVEKHSIDHNHFGPRPELGRNGAETIRIGTSQASEFVCRTTVTDNFFHQCDGEAEIISNKSCENDYRHNVFDQCSGALTLRHGHRCVVDANVFLGRKKGGTGGVRIIGQGHTVTNNYFEGLRGDAERAAICMMNGIPNGALNSYAPVKDADVSHNTFVDCKVSMEIGVGAGKKQSAAPTDCRVINNVFISKKWSLFRVRAQPIACSWKGNIQQGPLNAEPQFNLAKVDLKLKLASDGLLRPTKQKPLLTNDLAEIDRDIDGEPRHDDATMAGCDQLGTPFYKWPSASNTGPSWKRDRRLDISP